MKPSFYPRGIHQLLRTHLLWQTRYTRGPTDGSLQQAVFPVEARVSYNHMDGNSPQPVENRTKALRAALSFLSEWITSPVVSPQPWRVSDGCSKEVPEGVRANAYAAASHRHAYSVCRLGSSAGPYLGKLLDALSCVVSPPHPPIDARSMCSQRGAHTRTMEIPKAHPCRHAKGAKWRSAGAEPCDPHRYLVGIQKMEEGDVRGRVVPRKRAVELGTFGNCPEGKKKKDRSHRTRQRGLAMGWNPNMSPVERPSR